MTVAELNRLERALVDLLAGDLTAAKLEAVADAWCQRSQEAQLSWLHYHRADTRMGAALRNVLTIVSQTHDLGGIAADYDFMREWSRASQR
jgi:hypothetical protein